MIYKQSSHINYYDLNAQGDVKLSALLRRINLAAGDNADELGIGFDVMKSHGLAFVVQRFGLALREWPRFREEISIRTWPADISKGTFRRCGDMCNAEGEKIAEWTSIWVLIDINERKLRRPSSLPMELPAMGLMDVSVEAVKLNPPKDAKFLMSYQHPVQYSELDTNEHMNNAVYGDLIANSYGFMSKISKWQEVQINYQTEAVMLEELHVERRQAHDTMYISGAVKANKELGIQERPVFTASVRCEERER